jgi:phosphopantothenoylcysteine decarboxylase/phosphopantothenate--cysteine ligase
MTKAAQEFVSPLSFAVMSENQVLSEEFTASSSVEHIQLAKEADLFLIAPATANTIAKLAYGLADNLLTEVALAARVPIVICPAMNTNMYLNQATQNNLLVLKKRGFRIIEPEEGKLACGDEGQGRLAEQEKILQTIEEVLTLKDYIGQNVVVTAGPTREPLDPVRFLTNHSSGKMGYALAEAACYRGAEVTLISGPSNLKPPFGCKIIKVETALEMRKAVMNCFSEADVVIKAAAVSDYRPVKKEEKKIKKGAASLELLLVKNPDILEELGRMKTNQILVGFAAETEKVREYAAEKLKEKNLDLIVANEVSRQGIGFEAEDNEVFLVYPDGKISEIPLMSKKEVAFCILDAVRELPRFLEKINGRSK